MTVTKVHIEFSKKQLLKKYLDKPYIRGKSKKGWDCFTMVYDYGDITSERADSSSSVVFRFRGSASDGWYFNFDDEQQYVFNIMSQDLFGNLIITSRSFGINAIPVDTHVHRISNRLGLVKTKTSEQTEAELEKILPKRYWLDFNALLVSYGQQLCKPIKPLCYECPIIEYCGYKKKNIKK